MDVKKNFLLAMLAIIYTLVVYIVWKEIASAHGIFMAIVGILGAHLVAAIIVWFIARKNNL